MSLGSAEASVCPKLICVMGSANSNKMPVAAIACRHGFAVTESAIRAQKPWSRWLPSSLCRPRCTFGITRLPSRPKTAGTNVNDAAIATAITMAADSPSQVRKLIRVSASPPSAKISVLPAKTMPAPAVPDVRPMESYTSKPDRSSAR